jgi:predicted nucleic acid-binding protein
MTADKAFFDTNVLLYMYSTANLEKQTRAQGLFGEYPSDSRALLSTQVVQEFFVAALRKLLLPAQQVRTLALAFLQVPLVIIDTNHIRAAIKNEEQYRISFWDALIVAAAESAGAEVLYTEDLNDGQRFGTVLVCNPFRQN